MTRRLTTSILLGLVVFAGGCRGGDDPEPYDAGAGLVFEVPTGVAPEAPPSRAGTGAYGTLSGPGIRLTYELGSKVRQPSAGTGDVRVSLLSIDGRNAYVEYYTAAGDTNGMPFVATLYVEDAGGGNRFAMVVHAATKDGHGEAKRIFRSVDLPGVAEPRGG